MSSDVASINFKQFKTFFDQFVKWGVHNLSFEHLLFNYLDPDGNGFVFLEEVVSALETLLKKEVKERLKRTQFFISTTPTIKETHFCLLDSVCFKIYDTDKDEMIDRKQLMGVLNAITSIYCYKNQRGVTFFVPLYKIEEYASKIIDDCLQGNKESTLEGSERVSFDQVLAFSLDEAEGLESFFKLSF